MNCAREAQIESWIIDEHDRVRFCRGNFVQRFAKLFSKVTVLLHHFPQADDGGIADPVSELLARDRFHLRTAAPNERKIDI